MRIDQDRFGQLLLAFVVGLSLFVLGCGVKQLTTEVWEDGSGRNIFIMAAAKEQDDPEQAAQQQESLEETRQTAEECGARTLPYEDSVYKGYQAIFDFRSFSEVPGQVTCFLGDTTSLQIEGRYEERTEKRTYRIETRIKPFSLWGLASEDPMLYRVITPGQIVMYNDLQTAQVRTVRDAGNQISWYYAKQEGDDSDLEYLLSVQAEKLAPTAVVPPTVPPAVTIVVPTSAPPPTSPPPVTYVVPTSEVPPTLPPAAVTFVVPTSTASSPAPLVSTDLVLCGGIFLLAIILVVAVGILVWRVVGVTSRSQREPAATRTAGPSRRHPEEPTRPRHPTLPSQYPALGTMLDRYQIRDELGQGGMAAVYRARHETLQRDVALKILAPRLTVTPDFVERFRQEGRILAQLSHPHIVTVYDAGSAQGYYYLVMELVRGWGLDRALERWGKLEPRNAVAVAQQIAQALEYAHRERIIHRDIKPANILLDEKGRVKVADFGIVAILGESQVARTRIGTPRYMAYEHFNGAATPQSDLYSLAACLYEMLTGQCPPAFGLQTPIPPSHLNRAVSPALDHAVLKCLRPDPRRRYATAREFMTALKQTV